MSILTVAPLGAVQAVITVASRAETSAATRSIPLAILLAFGMLILADRSLAPRSPSDLTSDLLARGREMSLLVLGGALLLRLLALPMAPVLSNDVFRYAWDGRAVLSGANPYLLAPEAEELEGLRRENDEIWSRMHHQEVPTVYPPLALGLFAVGAATPAPVGAIKALLTAADLALCALLLALARRLGLEPARTIWYAWNPVAVVEVAGQGHVDGLAVALAVGAVLLVVRSRTVTRGDGDEAPNDGDRQEGRRSAVGAGLAAAAGALAKLGPVIALPMWARQSRRPVALLLAAAALLVVGFLPVAATVGVPPGLLTYGVSWEFNGPFYEPLWRGLDRLGADGWVKQGLEAAKGATGAHELWNRFYPYAYPQLMAKALLAPFLGLALLLSLVGPSRVDPVAGSGRLFGRALLLSATVYPWYLLWVLPWAALARQRAWLLAVALSPLAYLPGLLPEGTAPALFPWIWALVWGPPAAAALLPEWRRWSSG